MDNIFVVGPHLVPTWSPIGPIWCPLGPQLVPSGPNWSPFGPQLVPFVSPLGPIWSLLGPIMDPTPWIPIMDPWVPGDASRGPTNTHGPRRRASDFRAGDFSRFLPFSHFPLNLNLGAFFGRVFLDQV